MSQERLVRHDRRDGMLIIGVTIAAFVSINVLDLIVLTAYLLYTGKVNVVEALKETILIQIILNELTLFFWFLASAKHLFQKNIKYFYGESAALRKEILIGLGIGLTGFFLATLTAAFIERVTGFKVPTYFIEVFKPTSMENLLVWILTIWFLVAPVEELFFRGLIQTVMEGWRGGFFGVSVSSLIFGLIHFSPDLWPRSIVVFILGILYGSVFHQRKNISSCWVAHGINDTIVSLMLFFLQA